MNTEILERGLGVLIDLNRKRITNDRPAVSEVIESLVAAFTRPFGPEMERISLHSSLSPMSIHRRNLAMRLIRHAMEDMDYDVTLEFQKEIAYDEFSMLVRELWKTTVQNVCLIAHEMRDYHYAEPNSYSVSGNADALINWHCPDLIQATGESSDLKDVKKAFGKVQATLKKWISLTYCSASVCALEWAQLLGAYPLVDISLPESVILGDDRSRPDRVRDSNDVIDLEGLDAMWNPQLITPNFGLKRLLRDLEIDFALMRRAFGQESDTE